MCKACAVAIVAVALIGGAMWMYQSKYHHEKGFIGGGSGSAETPEDRVIDNLNRKTPSVAAYMNAREPAPASQPYGCGSYMKDCVPGEVGGCEQYRQTCASADNSVRMTMARPGECDQFRRQCAMGDYASCDLYNRGCLYEGN